MIIVTVASSYLFYTCDIPSNSKNEVCNNLGYLKHFEKYHSFVLTI